MFLFTNFVVYIVSQEKALQLHRQRGTFELFLDRRETEEYDSYITYFVSYRTSPIDIGEMAK